MTHYKRPISRRDLAKADRAKTEVNQLYLETVSEISLRRSIKQLLRVCGWKVRDLSQSRSVMGDLDGVPDMFAAKADHFLFVEAKVGANDLRPSQKRFRDEFVPETGKHLIYCVARSLDDITKVIGGI